jgi:glycosyltransferase involved in cell wall biosynthesis
VRILLLTQVYPPEPELRNRILAQALAERGHQVTVIAGFPNYPYGHLYPGYQMRPWKREVSKGITVFRLPLFPDHSRSGTRRALCYLSFGLSAATLGPVLSGPLDVAFITQGAINIGVTAWAFKLLRRVPFVFEIQDLWPESLAATGMGANALLLGAVERMAGFAYRQAAAISVISPGFKRRLVSKGVPDQKIFVHYNWIDQGTFKPLQPDPSLAAQLGTAGKFTILYAGNMGPAQDLQNAVEAAARVQDLKDVEFLFIGDGVELPTLQRLAQDKKLTNVRFLPRRPMAEMPAINALADALLVHLSKDPLFAITIPGKTQASLASGRPILGSLEGDAAELVANAGAGIIAPPGDPDSLARAVRELYAMPKDRREAMGASGRAYFERHLSADVLVGQLENLIVHVAQSRKRQR